MEGDNIDGVDNNQLGEDEMPIGNPPLLNSEAQNELDLKELEKLEQRLTTSHLTFKDAAMYVLWKSQRLMTATEVTDEALRLGLIKSGGRTPHATVASLINTDMKTKKERSIFLKFGNGRFSIRPNFVAHITQNIIAPWEQELGMTLLKGSSLPYIPFEHEHKWFDVKASQLKNSGMGLYARYKIQDHTVFSEYKGNIKEIPNDMKTGGDAEFYPYSVNVQMPDGSTKMIDGLDEDGTTVLSLAPRANDAGPIHQNCILAEYTEYPGRVFLESMREIQAGEEIFVCYGPRYWNVAQYPYLPELQLYGNMPCYSKPWKRPKFSRDVNNNNSQNTEEVMDDLLESLPPQPHYSCKPSADGMKLVFHKIKQVTI